MGETVLRVGNIRSEDDLELVRNFLDELGADYEHVDSDPEDSLPQTAYFQIISDLADDAEYLLSNLSEDHDFEPVVLM
jgi:hypothetical protein